MFLAPFETGCIDQRFLHEMGNPKFKIWHVDRCSLILVIKLFLVSVVCIQPIQTSARQRRPDFKF